MPAASKSTQEVKDVSEVLRDEKTRGKVKGLSAQRLAHPISLTSSQLISSVFYAFVFIDSKPISCP